MLDNLFIFLKSYKFYIAWIITIIASLTSFYLSDFLNFQPCILCFLQRFIFIFLSLFLALRIFFCRYFLTPILVCTILGMVVSLLHFLIAVGLVVDFCKNFLPCSYKSFSLKFVPLLSFFSFCLIYFLLKKF